MAKHHTHLPYRPKCCSVLPRHECFHIKCGRPRSSKTRSLREPARSKCTWTWYKSNLMQCKNLQENAKEKMEHLDQAPAVTLPVRTLVWTQCLGKKTFSRSSLLQILLYYACSLLRRKLETSFGAKLMPLKHAVASVLVCSPYLCVETLPEYPEKHVFAISILDF